MDDSIVSNNRNPNRTLTGTLVPTQVATTITGTFPYIGGKQITRNYTLRICFRGKCSAPEIKGLGGETFDFENFRVWGEKEKRCPFGQKTFATFGCQDENLVAYAPYDTAGDLKMYTGDSTNHLTGTSAQILGNNAPLDASIGDVQSYLTGQSFVEMKNGTKGIFIDNDGNGEYLKYTFDPDFLTGSFSIEMSVRGGALKRTGGTYELFKMWNIYLELFNNWNTHRFSLGFYDISNNSCNYWYCNKIELNNLYLFNWIDANKFYKVKTEFNWDNWKLSINWDWLISSIEGSWTWILNINSEIYIGSNNITPISWQWNDIIDYVKIYN